MGVPNYDRASLKSGIVHMSVGGFHRSHQAVYIDDLLNLAPSDWMISGVGLLDNDLDNVRAMQAQDCLYTVLERAESEDQAHIVGAMKDILHAPSDPAAVFEKLASPDTKILSLTITEKGYCYNKNRDLDETHPMVQHDLANPDRPKSALGYTVEALRRRMAANASAFTVMSCDNLPGNGHVARRIITQFAALRDPALAQWINDNVRFPSAMVDRITPVTTDATRSTLLEKFGVNDGWPVVCEDFRQWVLEDDFGLGRPDFEKVGVQIVKDVEPYEKMKVRLLNGSHSALSYISYLMGYRDVDLAMADPLIRKFVRAYMDHDITPSVPDVPGIDLTDYKDTLIRRFSNPAIRDQILRLAEDGSQKIQNAIVPCLEHQLKTGGSIKFAALALAAWFRFLSGTDEELKEIPLKDPLADVLNARAKIEPRSPDAILGLQDIFGATLSASPELRQEIAAALDSLYSKGARATLEAWLKGVA
ncbi:MAG: Mannitol dehydrogenase domain protein [Micavibrio sp.]|nr:Mannitol dehydrogenase domain protein [Micavibrio sp.]